MSALIQATSITQLPEDPWERRPGERAFAAFAHYRDLGTDRSLRRVGQDLGKSRAAIEKLSVKWDWVGRALRMTRTLTGNDELPTSARYAR